MAPVQKEDTRTFCCLQCNEHVKDMILGLYDSTGPYTGLDVTNFQDSPTASGQKALAMDKRALWILDGATTDTIYNHLDINPNAENTCYFCLRSPDNLNVPYVVLEDFKVPIDATKHLAAGTAKACTTCADLIKKELYSENIEHPSLHHWTKCVDCEKMHTITDKELQYREGLISKSLQCASCFALNKRTYTRDSVYSLAKKYNTRFLEPTCTKCMSKFTIDLLTPLRDLVFDYPDPKKLLCSDCRVLALPVPLDTWEFIYSESAKVVVTKLNDVFHYYIVYKNLEDQSTIKSIPSKDSYPTIQDAICVGFGAIDDTVIAQESTQLEIWHKD